MARKKRYHDQGAFYHVMIRGNRKQNIFFTDDHFELFCKHLDTIVQQYHCKIHLFCLMTNHVHLVIQVGNIPLSKIMQNINSIYARKLNDDIKQMGHVFQGRYKAILISNDNYLMELCYYIHNNPKKATIVSDLDDYPWSSHHSYKFKKFFPWITTQHIEKLLQNYLSQKKSAYTKFMSKKDNENAKPEFCQLDENDDLIIVNSINEQKNFRVEIDLTMFSIKEIIQIVCKFLEVDPDSINNALFTSNIVRARGLAAYFCHYHAHYTLTEISYYFAQLPSSVSRNLHKQVQEHESIKFIRLLEFEFLQRKSLLLSRKEALFDTARSEG